MRTADNTVYQTKMSIIPVSHSLFLSRHSQHPAGCCSFTLRRSHAHPLCSWRSTAFSGVRFSRHLALCNMLFFCWSLIGILLCQTKVTTPSLHFLSATSVWSILIIYLLVEYERASCSAFRFPAWSPLSNQRQLSFDVRYDKGLHG